MENQGTIFPSQGGGVLPLTPPLPEETRHSGDECRELFDDFNEDPDDELPLLEVIELL